VLTDRKTHKDQNVISLAEVIKFRNQLKQYYNDAMHPMVSNLVRPSPFRSNK